MPKISNLMRGVIGREIKERVFREGCNILRKDGWNGFTMEKLAASVGVAKGTLYNYFRDKLDVITYINEQVFTEMAEHIRPILERKGDCREILRECIHDSITQMEGSRLLRMVMVEMHRKALPLNEQKLFMRDPSNKVHDVFMKFFERGAKEGVFKPVSPEIQEIFLTSVFDGIDVHANFDPDFDISGQENLDIIIDMLVDGLSVHNSPRQRAKKK